MAGRKTVDFCACFFELVAQIYWAKKATGIQSKEYHWLRAIFSFNVRNECLFHTEQIIDIPIKLLIPNIAGQMYTLLVQVSQRVAARYFLCPLPALKRTHSELSILH